MQNTVNHLINYQIDGRRSSHSRYYQNCFDYAWNLYSKDLRAHFGCVNAIEFSSRESEHVASGGDDRRVLIWSIDGDILSSGRANPTSLRTQHHSNIFTLAWDNENKRIFSGGNDDQVLVHDVKTQQIVDIFLHADAVFCISVNPESSEIFATACENGQVSLYDLRLSNTDPIILSETAPGSAYQACCFNPTNSNLIATANIETGLRLLDLRVHNKVLVQYEAKSDSRSTRNPDLSKDVMSVKFNQLGDQLLALRSRCAPALYTLNDPKPTIQFDHEDYLNSCTLKNCCFVGDRDQYVCAGSDDFCVYVWKVAERDRLHFKLKGHRSIVNQVRYHPKQHMLMSSGVEKMIKVWTPYKLYNSTGGLFGHKEEYQPGRRLYTNQELFDLRWFPSTAGGDALNLYQTMEEDQGMIAFFDSLVRRELDNWSSEDVMDDPAVTVETSDDTSVDEVSDDDSKTSKKDELISFISDNDEQEREEHSSSSSSSCSSINSNNNKTAKVRVSLRDRIRNLRHRRSLNLTENSEYINVLDSLNVPHSSAKRERSSSSSNDSNEASPIPAKRPSESTPQASEHKPEARTKNKTSQTIKKLNQQRRIIELSEDDNDDPSSEHAPSTSMAAANTRFKKSRRTSESTATTSYRNKEAD